MKKTFLVLLGAAALCFGLFLLSKVWPGLSRIRLDAAGLIILGIMLTLPIAGAVLMTCVIRAWHQRDGFPGKGTRLAFYLVVLDTAALLLLPHFVKARTNAAPFACVAKQRMIEGAKRQWGMEFKKGPGDEPTQEDLRVYMAGGRFPVCEKNGTIIIGKLSEKVRCTAHPPEQGK